jgi:hypothetical protein
LRFVSLALGIGLFERETRSRPPSPPFYKIFRIIELAEIPGKILNLKGLNTKFLITNDLRGSYSGSPDRDGLDHDRANSMSGARSDVT